jgi:hypothetical protein
MGATMRKILAIGVTAGFAIGFMLLMVLGGASAAENTVKIPAGAKVTIKGNTAMINNGGGGGNNLSGSFQCLCSGGPGTCAVTSTSGLIVCTKGSGQDGCKSTCEFRVQTQGVKGIHQE